MKSIHLWDACIYKVRGAIDCTGVSTRHTGISCSSSLLPWISMSCDLIKNDFRFNNTANYLLKVARSVQLSLFIKLDLYSPTSRFIGLIKYCIDYVMLKLCHKMTFNEGNFFVVLDIVLQVKWIFPFQLCFPKIQRFRNEYDELDFPSLVLHVLHSGFSILAMLAIKVCVGKSKINSAKKLPRVEISLLLVHHLTFWLRWFTYM